jgi:hypothetical protein
MSNSGHPFPVLHNFLIMVLVDSLTQKLLAKFLGNSTSAEVIVSAQLKCSKRRENEREEKLAWTYWISTASVNEPHARHIHSINGSINYALLG